MDAPDHDRTRLVRSLARLIAHGDQLREKRAALQKHASGMLDHARHCEKVASEHLAQHDNVLVHRYAKTRMTEAARLSAIALRAEGTRDRDG